MECILFTWITTIHQLVVPALLLNQPMQLDRFWQHGNCVKGKKPYETNELFKVWLCQLVRSRTHYFGLQPQPLFDQAFLSLLK